MRNVIKILTIAFATTAMSSAIAQTSDPEAPESDEVTEQYRQSLQDGGLISKQIEINDTILMLEREVAKAQAIASLVDEIGYDARIELPNGKILDLSQTKAGRDARMKALQEEQILIDTELALQQKRTEAQILGDPAIQDAIRRAEQSELVQSLVDLLGADTTVQTMDGQIIDLSRTNAGKKKIIEDMTVEAELAEARAELEKQTTEAIRQRAERDIIEARRIAEVERANREAERARNAQIMQQRSQGGVQQVAQELSIQVTEIFGDLDELRATLLMNGALLTVRVGDNLGGNGVVKSIDRTSVVVENGAKTDTFYVY